MPHPLCRRCTCPVHHVLGNHCLKDISRAELIRELRLLGSYYRAELAPGWWLLVLDTTELSLHGRWEEGSAELLEAEVCAACE